MYHWIIRAVVYLLIPTSNHNLFACAIWRPSVVYLLIPTSNHNSSIDSVPVLELYIFWFLHQTTTTITARMHLFQLYIFWFLHQTTTESQYSIFRDMLYIFWFLHQTTTSWHPWLNGFALYIFWFLHQTTTRVPRWCSGVRLYIFWFLHQTTTPCVTRWRTGQLYIFWFLHQTTTPPQLRPPPNSCISFDSYIKPQPPPWGGKALKVVYLLIPTSNHNTNINLKFISWLYIFWFLHQTTTLNTGAMFSARCISFDSYIKPQHCVWC